MSSGLLFCFLGAISFGLLASVSKMAERRKCNASALVVSLFVWATVAMLVRTATLRSGFYLPVKAIGVGVACGICAAVAYFAFQSSIQIGKVTVGWLMMNLSAGVPALFSIWIYNETLSPLKLSAFALAGVSLLFLFWGHRAEEQEAEKLQDTKVSGRLVWLLLMLVILLTNGMSSFGLKVIAGWALPQAAKFPYLTTWYAAGFAVIAVPMWFKGTRVRWKELGWGAAMAALSMGGQVAMAMALDSNMPGHVVFPVTIGGSILVVALVGRFFFGERMNRLNTTGVVFGFLSVLLLSIE
jgi:drug/metabolite transporter (DMT)-like permease